jgi:hypothetical protein
MAIRLCDQCNGDGAVGFDRGPVTENCTGCAGVGLVATDERTIVQDMQRMLSVGGTHGAVLAQAGKGAELRLLLRALELLQRRVDELERQR